MNKLMEIGHNSNTIHARSKIGNNVVDYFTFLQRLETKGKYNINYSVSKAIHVSIDKIVLFYIFKKLLM